MSETVRIEVVCKFNAERNECPDICPFSGDEWTCKLLKYFRKNGIEHFDISACNKITIEIERGK